MTLRRTVFEPGPIKRDSTAVHSVTLRAVLTAIASAPGSTAADACRATGLSGATVSRLVTDLLHSGLVLEGERVRGKRGQPGVSLQMNPNGAYSAGCQIGFGSCHLFIRSLGGETVAEQQFNITGCQSAHVARAVAAAFAAALADAGDIGTKLVGLGVAAPADFDRLCEKVSGPHADSWSVETFRAELEDLAGTAVTTYSTGSAGAWAELAHTPPPRPADYLYLFVDRFLQSGLLMDGRLWVSPQDSDGALGRVLIGAGEARLYDLVGGNAWMQELAQADAPLAEIAARWASQAGEPLARAVQAIADPLALPLVVLDGNLPAEALDAMTRELSEQLLQQCWSAPPQVRRGLAGAHAPAMGAALRPLYTKFFADEADGY